MTYHAGLDVSLKEFSICIIDDDRALVAQGKAPSDSEGVASWAKDLVAGPTADRA